MDEIIYKEDLIRWLKKLLRLRRKLIQDKDVIENIYNKLLSDSDARKTVSIKILSTCNSLYLSLAFISNHLLNHSWWKTSRIEIPDIDKKLYISAYHMFSKIAFIQLLYSSIESSFRLYLKKLAPNACNNGTAEFNSIYKCLFHSYLTAIPKDGIDLLDLFRNIRNTIHNNGVFYNKAGTDSPVIWRGKKYEFVNGKPIDFITMDFIFSVVRAIGVLVLEVVIDPKLKVVKPTWKNSN